MSSRSSRRKRSRSRSHSRDSRDGRDYRERRRDHHDRDDDDDREHDHDRDDHDRDYDHHDRDYRSRPPPRITRPTIVRYLPSDAGISALASQSGLVARTPLLSHPLLPMLRIDSSYDRYARGGQAHYDRRITDRRGGRRDRSDIPLVPLVSLPLDASLPIPSTIQVSSGTSAKNVASLIAAAARMGPVPPVVGMGAGAVNEAVQAVAHARRILEDEHSGIDLRVYPSFTDKNWSGFSFHLTKSPRVTSIYEGTGSVCVTVTAPSLTTTTSTTSPSSPQSPEHSSPSSSSSLSPSSTSASLSTSSSSAPSEASSSEVTASDAAPTPQSQVPPVSSAPDPSSAPTTTATDGEAEVEKEIELEGEKDEKDEKELEAEKEKEEKLKEEQEAKEQEAKKDKAKEDEDEENANKEEEGGGSDDEHGKDGDKNKERKGDSERSRRGQPKVIQEIKVAHDSDPFGVAGCIAKHARDWARVGMVVIGQDSVMQAVKSVTIARTYLEDDAMDLSFRPHFTKVKGKDGRDKGGLKLRVLVQQV